MFYFVPRPVSTSELRFCSAQDATQGEAGGMRSPHADLHRHERVAGQGHVPGLREAPLPALSEAGGQPACEWPHADERGCDHDGKAATEPVIVDRTDGRCSSPMRRNAGAPEEPAGKVGGGAQQRAPLDQGAKRDDCAHCHLGGGKGAVAKGVGSRLQGRQVWSRWAKQRCCRAYC